MTMVIHKFLNRILPFLITGAVFSSCEDQISPELEPAAPLLVVDAFINNKVEDQKIVLTWSQSYLDNTLPPAVTGATVKVNYQGGELVFTESASEPGVYIWPATQTSVDEAFVVGRDYLLSIELNGETFGAVSRMNRTVPIDSVTFTFFADDVFYPDNTYIAEFWAKDAVGYGDTYWIRSYKNGQLLNKPSEQTFAFDAAFSPGSNFDGITFIPPIRTVSVDEEDPDGNELSPFQPGDSVLVELHSITLPTFRFLSERRLQVDRPGGFGELFSSPLANVSTNIINANASGTKAVGFFNVAAVSVKGKKLVP